VNVQGYENVQNTMKYTQLVNFKDDDYEATTATTEDGTKAFGKPGLRARALANLVSIEVEQLMSL
jgi:hypothetical protein